MPTIAQDKFADAARKRMIDLDTTIAKLAAAERKHRNSVSLAIRVPAALPDLHRRIARRLSLKPTL